MMPVFRSTDGMGPAHCVAAVIAFVLLLVVPATGFGIWGQIAVLELYMQPVNVHGYVMTRAQITGPHGGPILVKVRSTGEGDGEAETEEIAEIGEVYAGDAVLSKLYILPGETYRSYQIAWNRIRSERMDVAARAEFLSPQALAAGIELADGTRWQAPNGYFSPLIKTVVLKEKSGRIGTNPENWILLRVPFLFAANTPQLEENVLSVLLDAEGKIYQGALGKAFDRSPPVDGATAARRPYDMENFTYRVGYWGVGDEPQQAGQDFSNLWGLMGWAPDPARVQAGEQRIFGPVAGAHMEYFDSDGTSDAQGSYRVSIQWPCVRRGIPPLHIWVDPVVEMNIWMTLQTTSFNPHQSKPQPFMMHQDASFRCGYMEWDALTRLFLVDAIWLTGKVAVANEGGDLVQISGDSNVQYQAQAPAQTPTAQTTYDFDGDGTPDRAYLANQTTVQDTSVTPARSYVVPVIPQNTATAKWQAVYFSSSASNRSPTASALADKVPDLWRLADHAVNEKPAGKLASISPAALANTDIYVFRESTGELMVEMKGMKRSSNGASLDDVIDSRDNTFYWQTLIRGRAFDSVQSSFSPDRTDEDFEATNASMGFQSRYQDRENNTPAPGEWLKVIAINRTTGYTGSRRFQLGMPGGHTGANAVSGVGLYGDLSQYIPQITLRPPRLKVWARRIAQPTGGLAQSSSAPESERTYFIGHEGAATQNDKLVAIYTRWVDWDEDTGTETTLPDGLGINRGADFGLTGRLAKLNDGKLVSVSAGMSVTENGDATLQDAAQGPGQVAQFPIGPGEQMQILRLGSDLKVNEHYYINVFGKPVSRDACSPCDFEHTGANPDLLASRPNQYTPFYVPVYDEAATLKLKLERNKLQQAQPNADIGTVDPLYAWVMRPEYQFSLIDLEVSALDAVKHDENGQEVIRHLLSSDEAKITTGDELVRLLYRLVLSNEALLPAFDNPAANGAGTRQYVFAFGEEEVLLTADAHGQVEIDNLSQIFKLGVEDFLTARIYLNNDPGNLLWQFAYGTVQMAVDLNRNGCVEFTDKTRDEPAYRHCAHIQRTDGGPDVSDDTSPERPFRFWVNDDYDVVRNDGDIAPERTSCDGLLQPQLRTSDATNPDDPHGYGSINADFEQVCEQIDENALLTNNTAYAPAERMLTIESERDLEDFFPMALRLPETEGNLTLRWTATGASVNLFIGTWQDRHDRVAYDYLRKRDASREQVRVANGQGGHVIMLEAGTSNRTMSVESLKPFRDDYGTVRFLVEGTIPSPGGCRTNAENCYVKVDLVREAEGQMQVLGTSKVYFDLHRVGDFMDYWNAGLISEPEGASEFAPHRPQDIPDVQALSSHQVNILDGIASDTALASDYTLFVHGWRMKEQEKKDFAYTAFKRLYWSGYQGKFGFLTWPTGWFEKPDNVYGALALLYAKFNLANYNDSDATAHAVGIKLAAKLSHMTEGASRVHLIAHSMGNVVVSEALRHPGTSTVKSYVASQAAEVAGAYWPQAQSIQHKRLGILGVGDGDNEASGFIESWLYYHLEGVGTEEDRRYLPPPDLYRDGMAGVGGDRKRDMRQYPDPDLPGDDRHYYKGIGSDVRIVNAHNRGDAALRAWELNQLFKPPFDMPFQHDNAGDWNHENEYTEIRAEFSICRTEAENQQDLVAVAQCDATFSQRMADLSASGGVVARFINNYGHTIPWVIGATDDADVISNATILTHAIPARTNALGQMSGTWGELGVNPPEINLRSYDNGNQGHSGQFYSSLAERKTYWDESLLQGIFFDESTRAVSCLAEWVDAAAGECGRP